MRNPLTIIGAVALLAACATGRAAPPYTIQFTASACETNTSAVTTYTPNNDLALSGFVDTIIVDQTGTGTGTVSVATVASKGSGPSRSVLLDTSVSADGAYPVRDIVTTQAGADIANVPARIPLTSDHLRLTLYNWGATNNTVAVWVVVTDEP